MFSRAEIIARYPHYFAIRTVAHLRFPCGGYARLVRADNVNDRLALAARDPSKPFVWALHSRGTHIITPTRYDRYAAETLVRTIDREYGLYGLEFHAWDGSELRRLTLAQTIAFLLEQANDERAWARLRAVCK